MSSIEEIEIRLYGFEETDERYECRGWEPISETRETGGFLELKVSSPPFTMGRGNLWRYTNTLNPNVES
jgi:hypothetical protein